LAAEAGTLPFDKVIVSVNGERREIAPADLLALPLHLRVQWLLDDSLEFYQGARLVDRREALAALRHAQLGAAGGATPPALPTGAGSVATGPS
jgi:hypothetical protein